MSTKFKALKANPLAKVTNPGGGTIPNYTYRVLSTCPGNLIAYWPMAEGSGGTAQDESGNGRTGSYNNITLGATGNGDGRTAASWGANTGMNNVYTAGLNTAFERHKLTISAWILPSDNTTWSDNVTRQVMRLAGSGNQAITLQKNLATSRLQSNYITNGSTQSVIFYNSLSGTAWIHIAVTVDKSASAHILYCYGDSQVTGTTLANFDWDIGTSLVTTTANIGAQDTTGTTKWSGTIAHVALWGTALTAPQIKFLSKAF